MSELQSLFSEELEDNGITIETSATPERKLIDRLWGRWCFVTKRGKSDTPKEVADNISHLVSNGWTEQDIFEIVDGASRTPVRPRDSQDVRRLIMALSNPKHRKFALSALHDEEPVISFPEKKNRMSFSKLEELVGTSRGEWGESDIEAAVMLCEKYPEEDLGIIVDKCLLYLGHSALFPSEVLRNIDKIRKSKIDVKKKADRNSYATGAAETARTKDINFYADKEADKAYNKNIPIAIIQRMHDMAPDGYWDEVSKLIRSTKKSHDVIYSSLTQKYNWHPSDRGSFKG